jgi:hypothetical protein
MSGYLFPQSVNLLLLSHVLDRVHHFAQIHLLVDKVLSIRLDAFLTPFDCVFEVIEREWQRLPIFSHQLIELQNSRLHLRTRLANYHSDRTMGVAYL